MKNILSLFICTLIVTSISLHATEQTIEQEHVLQAGFLFDADFFTTHIFHKIELSPNTVIDLFPHTWGINIKPHENISLKIGSITYSGIWSRFNNPSPIAISPTKQPYSIQKRFVSTIPTKTSSEKPTSLSLLADFSHISLNSFASISSTSESYYGLGFSIPLISKNQEITATLTSAWKMSLLLPKEDSTWFTDEKFFKENYFHAFIQEVSLETNLNTMLLGFGMTQMTQGTPAGFFRWEHSVSIEPFLLNSQVFLSDINYIGQSGSIQKETLQVGINPQLRFKYYSGLIRAWNIGLTATTELQNDKNPVNHHIWNASLKASSTVTLIFLSLTTSFSFSDVMIENTSKSPVTFKPTEESIVNSQIKLLYNPWYFPQLKRIWTLQVQYEKKPLVVDDKGSIFAKLSIRSTIPFEFFKKTQVLLSGELDYNVSSKQDVPNLVYSIKLLSEIPTLIQTNTMQVEYDFEIHTQEKINKLQSKISIIFIL